MKVVARLHLARMPLSLLEQMVYFLQSGSNSSVLLDMYGTTVSNHTTRLRSLHPNSMKVSNEPPGDHLRSPVAKPSKQFYSLRKYNRHPSNIRDSAATFHGVLEEDICRPAWIPL